MYRSGPVGELSIAEFPRDVTGTDLFVSASTPERKEVINVASRAVWVRPGPLLVQDLCRLATAQ